MGDSHFAEVIHRYIVLNMSSKNEEHRSLCRDAFVEVYREKKEVERELSVLRSTGYE